MDVLPRIARQLTELIHDMSPLQRLMSMAVSCLVLCGFSWMVFLHQQPEFQAVSYGKVFAADELISAERALTNAGLTGFRREGRKLLAPTRDLGRYNAALLESDALPADLGTQMLKQYEKLGPFSTDRQRQQMKEAFLLQELRRMIKEVPDVEDAHVAIASSERRGGWNQKPRSTANVSLKPRSGRELSSGLINSLRHVVANMVPDLKPTDVTVFDVTRGQAYTGETTDDPTDSQYLQRAREFTRQYEQQIEKALSHIPFVSVTVHVDLDTLKSSMIRSETLRSKNDDRQVADRPGPDTNSDSHLTGFRGSNGLPTETIREVSEKQLVSAMPRAVRVCVSIPRDYLRDVIARRTANGEKADNLDPSLLEDEELTKVERIVGRLIPANSPDDAVSVTFIDRLIDESPQVTSQTSMDQFTALIHQWGGFAGVAVVLVVLTSWLVRSPSTTTNATTSTFENSLVENKRSEVMAPTVEPDRILPTPDRMAILRDEIRSLVEGDPVASADLLSRWLSEVSQ